jgi:hypothetical protein
MVSRTEARSDALAREAFVEQKNGAVVRRLMDYGRFGGVETARVVGRLYAAARLYVNFFQPSFKLKEKRREGAKVIKRYHPPSTPYERTLAHPKVTTAVKKRLRDQYRSLDPIALLAEIRVTQEEFGNRVDRRAGQGVRPATRQHKHRASDRSHFCEDARQDDEGRRAACHTPAIPSAL